MLASYINKIMTLKSFFYKGHERSVNAKRNILFSFGIKGLNILISLMLVPLTIDYINPTRYGIWLTLSSIIGWLSFFDIGFGNGLRNKFAEAMAAGEKELARKYVSTTYAVLAIIISVVLIIFVSINPFLNWAKILNTPPEMVAELSVLALVVFVFFCLQFVLQLITTIITANQQSAKASFYNLLGSVFSLMVIYVLTKTTQGNLLYLSYALGLTPVVVLAISSLYFFNGEYKYYAPSIKYVKFSYTKDLMGLGLKFFLIQISAIVLFQSNNIIISQLFGPEQVTPYNITYKYFGVITMIAGIIMTPLWSAYTEAWVKKDFEWIKKTVRKLQYLWLLLFGLSLFMLVVSPFVYHYWLGGKVIISFSLSAIMCLYVLVIVWNMIFVYFLNGVGKIRLQLYSSFFGTIMTIPLTYYFAILFGIIGIIVASCVLGLINTLWTYFQYSKLVSQTAKGIWNE